MVLHTDTAELIEKLKGGANLAKHALTVSNWSQQVGEGRICTYITRILTSSVCYSASVDWKFTVSCSARLPLALASRLVL